MHLSWFPELTAHQILQGSDSQRCGLVFLSSHSGLCADTAQSQVACNAHKRTLDVLIPATKIQPCQA
jgi:hypothetical protein